MQAARGGGDAQVLRNVGQTLQSELNVGPPVRDRAAGTFSLQIPITPGYTHVLQKSTSGRDGTWIDVTNTSGNSTATLKYEDANDPTAVYRVQLR